MVWDILLALFSVIGLAACVRFAAGLLLYPVRGALIFLPARGDGRELEHQLKGLRALSSDGRLEGETVFLTDMGLSEEGLEAGMQLCRRYPSLRFCVLKREDKQAAGPL